MTTKIQFVGTRAQARALAFRLRDILVGRESDPANVAKGFQYALGFGALSDIKSAFVTKSRGGADEMGINWPPLKPETIARRRVGPGDLKGEANLAIKMREDIRKRLLRSSSAYYKATMPRLLLTLTPEVAKKRYAQMVGQIVTGKLELTRTQVLGYRDVDILRDTGVLLNSLTPGTLGGATYSKPAADGGDKQIFNPGRGEMIVGTNVPYANIHDQGGGKIPRRQFLPANNSEVPEVWWQRWLDIGVKALEAGAAILWRQGAA